MIASPNHAVPHAARRSDQKKVTLAGGRPATSPSPGLTQRTHQPNCQRTTRSLHTPSQGSASSGHGIFAPGQPHVNGPQRKFFENRVLSSLGPTEEPPADPQGLHGPIRHARSSPSSGSHPSGSHRRTGRKPRTAVTSDSASVQCRCGSGTPGIRGNALRSGSGSARTRSPQRRECDGRIRIPTATSGGSPRRPRARNQARLKVEQIDERRQCNTAADHA